MSALLVYADTIGGTSTYVRPGSSVSSAVSSAALLLVVSCTFNGPTGTIDAGESADAAPPPDCESWGNRHLFVPCDHLPNSSLGARTIDSTTIFDSGSGFFDDATTEVGTLFEISGTQTRVLLVDSFTVTSTGRLRLVGEHPVLIASISDVKIEGIINLSSLWRPPDSIDGDFEEGAGANHSNCPPVDDDQNGGLEGESDNAGGGGGGGGGFGDNGGNGGDGEDGNRDGGDNGLQIAEITLRGGCPGGRGGEGDDMPNSPAVHDGGRSGSSGGALVISSITSITIDGAIHAGGAGGRGQLIDHRHGGGGGGSGGLIELEAADLIVSEDAILAANGGAGGAGVNNLLGDDVALNGRDSTRDGEPALGGTGEGSGSGSGGWGDALNVNDNLDGHVGPRGGGGGGGSVGYILFVDFGESLMNVSAAALISPAFMSIPIQPAP